MSSPPTLPAAAPAVAEPKFEESTAGSTSAEVICFPGLDMKAIADALRFWKRTGKPYKDAPD